MVYRTTRDIFEIKSGTYVRLFENGQDSTIVTCAFDWTTQYSAWVGWIEESFLEETDLEEKEAALINEL